MYNNAYNTNENDNDTRENREKDDEQEHTSFRFGEQLVSFWYSFKQTSYIPTT